MDRLTPSKDSQNGKFVNSQLGISPGTKACPEKEGRTNDNGGVFIPSFSPFTYSAVFGLLAPSCSPSKITSTPILPKPNLDHLKASATLSTKRQSQKSRLHSRPVDSLLNPDDDAEDREASLRHWKLHFSDASLHSSFLHHTSHPLSPIKALAPQSRVFVRPRIDRASVVSFANTTSSSSSLPLTPQLQQQQLEPLRQLSPLYDDKSKREYIEQCFDVEMKIGEGSFGEVFQGDFLIQPYFLN